MLHISLFDQVVDSLGDLAKQHGLAISVRGDLDDPRGAAVDLENDTFIISATRERDEETIWVHCKVRPRPRAHLRTYYMGALAAFIEGRTDPYSLRSFADDAADLLRHEKKILSDDFLNAEDLRSWLNDASRRRYGPKK